MTDKLFSGRMRLADLITGNPNVILMLPRFGIDMGFGEATVDAICQRNHVPSDFFLMVCNVYSFDGYRPSEQEIRQTDMSILTDYLTASHNYYMESRLPHIESHLKNLATQVGRYGNALLTFYSEYKRELAEHFAYEEQTVFPYIAVLQSDRQQPNRYRIAEYAHAHHSVDDKLNDLIQIIFKYLPANQMVDETIEMIFDILQFSADLNKHSLIEDKILVPYVETLEKGRRISAASGRKG